MISQIWAGETWGITSPDDSWWSETYSDKKKKRDPRYFPQTWWSWLQQSFLDDIYMYIQKMNIHKTFGVLSRTTCLKCFEKRINSVKIPNLLRPTVVWVPASTVCACLLLLHVIHYSICSSLSNSAISFSFFHFVFSLFFFHNPAFSLLPRLL